MPCESRLATTTRERNDKAHESASNPLAVDIARDSRDVAISTEPESYWSMPRYVYAKVLDLEGTAKVGTGQCAVLVQHYAGAPLTANWRAGPAIRGARNIAVGTALATFVNGRYPNRSHGNHAALYISQDATGVRVMDQWTTKESVSSRVIRFKGRNKDGTYKDPSNNADALFIIE